MGLVLEVVKVEMEGRGMIVAVAVPDLEASAVEVARIVTVPPGTEEGAVYMPVDAPIVPLPVPSTDHVTPIEPEAAPVTVGVKVVEVLTARFMVLGATVTPMELTEMVMVALLVGSAVAVALRVTEVAVPAV